MKIVVLAGGLSTERDVSLVTGSMIYRALKNRGHKAILLDVFLGYNGSLEGEQLFEADKDWTEGIVQIAEANPDLEKVKTLRPDWKKNFFGPRVIEICQSADIVFMALHGKNGEDGKIQACFDLMGIKYTGCGYAGSVLAMDKGITKELFKQYQVPTPSGFRLKKGEKEREQVIFPCMVKTVCGGSSVGVYIVRDAAEYEEAKKEAFRYDDEVVIEQYIKGREFSVGVLQGKALPVIEIAPLTGFYDYKNKYQAGSTVETCPAALPEEKTRELQTIAELGYEVLRISGYGRLDFMMDEAGQIYCLEANTLPGMTPTSLLPQEAAAVGMDFEELCEKIIEIAMEERES